MEVPIIAPVFACRRREAPHERAEADVATVLPKPIEEIDQAGIYLRFEFGINPDVYEENRKASTPASWCALCVVHGILEALFELPQGYAPVVADGESGCLRFGSIAIVAKVKQ